MQAISNAGREDEMILTGAGGSANAMAAIKEGGIYAATFLYNPIMAASAVNLARLIAHGCGLQPTWPSRRSRSASSSTRRRSPRRTSTRLHAVRVLGGPEPMPGPGGIVPPGPCIGPTS